ncbi:TetR family transcriptional regulator [Actinomadura sp. NBRC 104425]|uniref:TetR/AcrR family transcriptional regulator n=1 Tax=Actinomadura sp. NBRC 104425 TaxID=3032204 RepID=UPI0024A4338D|nr:TetR-like C-terminal domain-containing protein [Actinomadura sp. NBRC 104425]GLZ16223.1 TetR family transcriptional regulator [Actinomadura sp. NBRC 104425]
MPRAGLSTEAVVDAAIGIVDAHGPGALTLAAVAKAAGVAAPSLYKHVRNLAELRDLVTRRVMEELTERLQRAAMGRSGDDAVRAVMQAYRSYVTDHPSRYAAMSQQPLTDPRMALAGERLLEVVLAVLRGYDLDGPDLVHAARCLRSAVHGFAVLEAAGAFGLPEDTENSYELLVRMVVGGLRAAPPPEPNEPPIG